MPRMGTMAGAASPFAAEDTGSLIDTTRKAVSDIGAAVTLREMLSGLGAAGGGGKTSSGDSSILGGVGQLVGGLGTAFKGMSETQTALFSSLLGKNQGGGDQNQMLMFVLLMQVMQQGNERAEGAMAKVLETINTTWEARYKDLEQRSGPSQADQVTHQLTTSLLAEAIQQSRRPPADPIETLIGARERLQKLGVNAGGLFGGAPDQYTEGYLRHRELHNDLQKVIAQYSWQGQQRQATVELTKAILEGGPQLVQSLVVGTLQTLAGLGYLPGIQAGPGAGGGGAAGAAQADAPDAVAQAEAALARASGAQ